MVLSAYATSTSVTQGGVLRFRLSGGDRGQVLVHNAVTGEAVAADEVSGAEWSLAVPRDWASSLYRARFEPGEAEEYFAGGDTDEFFAGGDTDEYFVVRAHSPGADSRVLVSVPILTWHAYHRLGVPGEGLYPAESPLRAVRVSLDRSGVEPAGHWEDRFYSWLVERDYQVDYCSNLDLHTDPQLLSGYRLLVCAGHDEYWTHEMRQAAEQFVATGGNIAFFTGNTCWWQARLEDDARTVVCYRDALRDPLVRSEPERTTVEWSSAPVHRPENSLTGVSYRNGAGCWENMAAIEQTSYTAVFADHWVYHGTGVTDQQGFGLGSVGYETDAADFRMHDGMPVVTGQDGTSADFVILATADLRHWRDYGQGGHATMGIMRTGGGTVFNAATVGWSNALDDPVVSRITSNVIDQLSGDAPEWEPMGRVSVGASLTTSERYLFAGSPDGTLAARWNRVQNLPWHRLGSAPGLQALGAPSAAVPGCPVRLYGLFADGRVYSRVPAPEPAAWSDLYPVPPGAIDLVPVDERMYVLTADGRLWHRPLRPDPPEHLRPRRRRVARPTSAEWLPAGSGPGLAAMTAMTAMTATNGRLFAVSGGHELLTRLPRESEWDLLCKAPGATSVTVAAGRVVIVTDDGYLRWRDLATMIQTRR